MTGIRVFSLEEALYHCLVHWRQSVDIICDPFIRWVEGSLGLGHIGVRLREIGRIDSFCMRYLAFLSLIDYLPKDAVLALQSDLQQWEKRQAWEKLAEQADHLMAQGNAEHAYVLYAKALVYEGSNNIKLLNNCGIALMHIGEYEQAAAVLSKAVAQDASNAQLRYNLIEALIFAGEFYTAQNLVEEGLATVGGHVPLLNFFQGEIYFHGKSYFEAVKMYELALRKEYNPTYIYRLCDALMRVRLFDKALITIETVREVDRDIEFLRKQAEYYAAAYNIPSAIKSIEKALVANGSSGELWLILAQYHRMDYDLYHAAGAIHKALALMPDNPAALLEQARIRKAQGRTKEYHVILNKILTKMKLDFRKQRSDVRDGLNKGGNI